MKFDTICVQGAHKPAENRNTPPVPIYQTTAFSFDSVQYAADLFDLKAGVTFIHDFLTLQQTLLKNV